MATKPTPEAPAKKPRRSPLTLKPPPEVDPHEDVHQERIMALARAFTPQNAYLAALFHVPNGGFRHAREAAALERRGVKPGVSDLLLPIPLGGYAGLAIELKRFRSGQPTDEQKAWLALLAASGHRCVLCRGWRAAWREIWRYVHLPPTGKVRFGGSPTTRKDTDP